VINVKSVMIDLQEIISEEIRLNRTLLSALADEKEAIAAFSLEGINQATATKEGIVSSIHSLEERRQSLVSRLAERLQLDPGQLTLARLARLVKKPFADELEKSLRDLRELVRQIDEANRENAYYIQFTLGFISDSISLIQSTVAPLATYSAGGKVSHLKLSGRMLRREV
jgi:flagellar biosynthesis/type III secretory pathway chaperone